MVYRSVYIIWRRRVTTENGPALPDPASSYAKALDSTRKFFAGMGDVNLDAPTPCGEWSVRELINHILYGTVWIEDVFDGKTIEDVGSKYDGDLLGDNPLAAYDDAIGRAKRAVAKPGAMDQVCHLRRGDASGGDYLTSMFTDAFIHGWDLAKGTGQDATLDQELVETCYALAKAREERFRSSPAFGAGRVEDPGDGAIDQARMLAILGREADWSA
jgi:uncharacterized protein (TIGR03086 family)